MAKLPSRPNEEYTRLRFQHLTENRPQNFRGTTAYSQPISAHLEPGEGIRFTGAQFKNSLDKILDPGVYIYPASNVSRAIDKIMRGSTGNSKSVHLKTSCMIFNWLMGTLCGLKLYRLGLKRTSLETGLFLRKRLRRPTIAVGRFTKNFLLM